MIQTQDIFVLKTKTYVHNIEPGITVRSSLKQESNRPNEQGLVYYRVRLPESGEFVWVSETSFYLLGTEIEKIEYIQHQFCVERRVLLHN